MVIVKSEGGVCFSVVGGVKSEKGREKKGKEVFLYLS
jgi:hypothetical protein